MSEIRTVNRRTILGRLGGASIASAFVLAGRDSFAQSTGDAGDATIVLKATIATGSWCGHTFVARATFTPDSEG